VQHDDGPAGALVEVVQAQAGTGEAVGLKDRQGVRDSQDYFFSHIRTIKVNLSARPAVDSLGRSGTKNGSSETLKTVEAGKSAGHEALPVATKGERGVNRQEG
jgi:hypothetical protein